MRLLPLAACLLPLALSAQTISVHLADGSTMYGRLERKDADSVVIVGSGGRVAFAAASVREMRDAGKAHARDDGTTEYWFPNANTTRLFFAPTGRTLAQGEGYFADHDVIIGSVAVGLTDQFTLGGGTLLIPSSQFWFVTPKVGIIRKPNINVAVGALFGGFGDNVGGIAFTSATFGDTDNSATISLGKAFSGTKSGDMIVMGGAERRLSRRVSFVTENYLIPGTDPLISYGMRILGEKFSVDLAFMNSAGKDMVFSGIPYVDFVVRW